MITPDEKDKENDQTIFPRKKEVRRNSTRRAVLISNYTPMKKLPLFLVSLAVLTLAGCTQKAQEPTWSQTTGETIVSNATQYSWELVVAGVGPDESFEQTIAGDTLALKQTFDDHSDHVFFSRQMWSNYLDIQEDLIPWNRVKFVGSVKALDAAAGNHYYEVVTVNELTKVWVPTQTEVEALIDRYGYCEKDADCVGVYGQCPLWCHIGINAKFEATVQKIMYNFGNNTQAPQCTYKCAKMWKVTCNKNKCEVKY